MIEIDRKPVVAHRAVALRVLAGIAMTLAVWVVAVAYRGDPVAVRLSLSADLRVVVFLGREIELELLPAAGEGYAGVARRVSDGARTAPSISAWNGDRPLRAHEWIRVPLSLLSTEYRSMVLRNVFSEDRHDGKDWLHTARNGALATYDEGLWQVAEWFTGRGDNFQEIMRHNGISSPELHRGQTLRIPAELLHPAFRTRSTGADGALEFSSDPAGPFAGYRLRPGEALYSAVVVRYTGRTGADDVNSIAESILARSGIRDPRDIPAHFGIKIPLELLEPEFLPADHPRRVEAEALQAELDRALANRPLVAARNGLEDVLIILDPGHGGRDLGTMNNGIWEHDYVYDVTCRLKRRLENETRAKVRLTLIDTETGCVPSNRTKLVANQQGTIQTTPPFLARKEGQAKIGVNLRWYLANSIYRSSLSKGYDADRILFMSIHADSRHPSLSGVMVYVPGAGYRTKTYGSSGSAYRPYLEVKEKPHISFSRTDRVRSEAVSRKLADAMVRSFRSEELPIQRYQPIRDKIIRGKSRYVPAVIRANAIPAKVLVEMVNLSNRDDAALLASAADRERLAQGLFNGILRHYGEKPRPMSANLGSR